MYTGEKKKWYSAEWVEKRKAKGICVKCGVVNNNPTSTWYCAECLQLKKKYHKDFAERRKAAGLCLCCGLENDNLPKVNCKKCSAAKATYARNRHRGMTEEAWQIKKLTLDGITYANAEALEIAKKERKRLKNLAYSRKINGTDPNRPILEKRGYCNAVEVVDAKSNQVIDTYVSQAEMAKDLGISQTYASMLARSEKVIEGIYYKRKEVK